MDKHSKGYEILRTGSHSLKCGCCGEELCHFPALGLWYAEVGENQYGGPEYWCQSCYRVIVED